MSTKVKTCSAAKKRFRRSGGKKGLIKRAKAYHRHLLTKKSSKRKRSLIKAAHIGPRDMKRISALMPY